VKNNMQIISSLLRLQAHATDSTKLQAAYEVGLNRIRSMALVHESLYRSQNLSSVDFQEYLQQMTGHLLSLYNHRDKHIDLEIKGGEIYLDISQAIPCGLIVNEIVSNSLKYAFPHNNGGRIEISLLNLESGKHSLTILDNGIGLPQGFDLQKVPTLGMQLIVDLVKQIDGILAVESSQGTVFKIIF
jgi:hypothetical protein